MTLVNRCNDLNSTSEHKSDDCWSPDELDRYYFDGKVKRMFKIFVMLALALAADCFARHKRNGGGQQQSCSRNYNFDYIYLSIQWPGSFCFGMNHCKTDKNRWSIHGAWPQYFDGQWPQDCCFERDFNPEEIEPIRDRLEKDWPTLAKKKNNDNFWRHEWSKHGTCAMKSQLKGALNYFNKTLEMFKQIKIEDWLSEAGVKPSKDKTSRLNVIQSAVEKGLGKKVQVQCKTVNGHGPMLDTIFFCFDKNMEFIDCPQTKNKNCGKKPIFINPVPGSGEKFDQH